MYSILKAVKGSVHFLFGKGKFLVEGNRSLLERRWTLFLFFNVIEFKYNDHLHIVVEDSMYSLKE